MVFVFTSIESNLLHAGFKSPLGNFNADQFRRFDISAISKFFTKGLFLRVSRGQCLARLVINNLNVNILMTSENSQARTSRISLNSISYAKSASFSLFADQFFVFHDTVSLVYWMLACRLLRHRLTLLTSYRFAKVTNSFTLIRFRFS